MDQEEHQTGHDAEQSEGASQEHHHEADQPSGNGQADIRHDEVGNSGKGYHNNHRRRD
ncbi:hypothetical protein D3C81_2243160 [compost metagenome]